MVHVATYLPTAGKEVEYLDDLAKMKISIEELLKKFDNAATFVRGDCNSSKSNPNHSAIFSTFQADLNLVQLDLQHNTYHHFLGQGTSDSELDVLLFSGHTGIQESLLGIHCKQVDSRVDSHHDLLVSSCTVPPVSVLPPDTSTNVTAPKLSNDRIKIVWNVATIAEYERVVSLHLPRIRQQWLNPSSEISMTILLQCTDMILSQSAILLNKSISLSSSVRTRSRSIPKYILRSNRRLTCLAKKIRYLSGPNLPKDELAQLKLKYKVMKAEHQKLVRRRRMEESSKRDSKIFSICSTNPHNLFQVVRTFRKTANVAIKKLRNNGKMYEGDLVDGFYDSINHLKTEAHSGLDSSSSYQAACQEYKNILRICQEGTKLPKMTLSKTREILFSIRPAVTDHNSMSGFHYRYAGEAGLQHLHELLNTLIDDLNNIAVDPLNTALACILHKGHGKDRTLSDSYRTISTCPVCQ